MALLIVLLTGVAILVGVLLWKAGTKTTPTPEPLLVRQRDTGGGVDAAIQLLFAETRPTLTTIDCVLLEPVTINGTPMEVGTPVSFDVRLPETPLVRESVRHLLREWADGCRVVRVDLRPGRTSPQLRIHAGSATVQLDLQSA